MISLTSAASLRERDLVAEHRSDEVTVPGAQVRERYRGSHERMIEAVRGLSEAVWEAGVPPASGSAPQQTAGDLLVECFEAPGYPPFGHAFAHVDDVRGVRG